MPWGLTWGHVAWPGVNQIPFTTLYKNCCFPFNVTILCLGSTIVQCLPQQGSSGFLLPVQPEPFCVELACSPCTGTVFAYVLQVIHSPKPCMLSWLVILNCMQAVCGCVPFGKPYLGRWFGMWMKLLKDGSRNQHGTFFFFSFFSLLSLPFSFCCQNWTLCGSYCWVTALLIVYLKKQTQ